MPIIQIDWDGIKERFDDETAIFAFTHRQVALLLSLTEQLNWRKTFDAFGYDFSDKDDLDLEIDDLRNNIMSPVNITDIVQYIDDVETILTAILQAQSEGPGCCPDGVQYHPVTPVSDFDTVPQPIVDAGYASDTSDVESYYDYRCMAGNLFLSNVQEKLDRLTPIIAGGFALFNILAGVFTFLTAGIGTATIVIAGIAVEATAIIALVQALKDVSSILPSQWADDLEDCRDDIVCAMTMADGQEAVKEAFLDAVESCLGSVEREVIALLNLDATLHALWYGQSNGTDVAQLMADNGLDPADYDCGICVADYISVFDFGNGTCSNQNWQKNASALLGAYGVGGSCGIAVPYFEGPPPAYLSITASSLHGWESLSPGNSCLIRKVEFWYATTNLTNAPKPYLQIIHSGGTWTSSDYALTTSFVKITEEFSPPLEIEHAQADAIAFHPHSGTGNYFMIDDVTIEWDEGD